MSNMRNIIRNTCFFCIAAGLASSPGIYLVTTSANQAMQAQASLNWPVAQGEVITAKVGKRFNLIDLWSTILYPQGGTGGRDEAIIQYKYRVGAMEYTSETISFGENETRIESPIQVYPAGKMVPVRFNPANPAIACLEAGGSNLKNYSLFGFGLLLTLFIWLLLAWRYFLGNAIFNYRVFTSSKRQFSFSDLFRKF
jgi:hypothetical protein